MSLKNVNDVEVTWSDGETRHFDTLVEMGFNDYGAFVIRSDRFFTCVPISPAAHRRRHSTKARAIRMTLTKLDIFDDWGNKHRITAPLHTILDLVDECRSNGLPVI